jgi:hypothetical protein
MITTKHERDVWVYRLKNVVYAEFNTTPEAIAFGKWHKPIESEFPLTLKEELRGLDHINVQPEGYQHRYEAYIDGLCEAYTAEGTNKPPNTNPVPPSIVGNHLRTGDKQDHIIHLLELILQAIKEK